jgi:hypothetical protein
MLSHNSITSSTFSSAGRLRTWSRSALFIGISLYGFKNRRSGHRTQRST